MSLHDDLLEQANHLAHREPGKPRQASLRRSVSAAYYGLFHLLVREGVQTLVSDPELKKLLTRAFDQSEMKRVSRAFVAGNLPVALKPYEPVPQDLQVVSRIFADLQEARHQADYDIGRKPFSRREVTQIVLHARNAFEAWERAK